MIRLLGTGGGSIPTTLVGFIAPPPMKNLTPQAFSKNSTRLKTAQEPQKNLYGSG